MAERAPAHPKRLMGAGGPERWGPGWREVVGGFPLFSLSHGAKTRPGHWLQASHTLPVGGGEAQSPCGWGHLLWGTPSRRP